MRKILSMCMALTLVFSLTCSAFASEPHEITQEEMLAAIENGTATVSMESRDIGSYTEEEIAQSPNLQRLFSEIDADPLSTKSYRDNGEVYTATVQSGGDVIDFLLYPYTELVVTDAGTYGSSDIHTSLKLMSSVAINGVYNDEWDNYIRLGSIDAWMGCGDNTVFTGNVTVDGNVPNSLSGGIAGLSALIGFCTSTNAATAVSSILALFSSIKYDNSYRNYYKIDPYNVRAVGIKWKTNLMIWDVDHSLKCYSSISTLDSNKAKNATTYAAARWEFDVYYGTATGPKYTNVRLEPSGPYIVNGT